MCLQNRRAGQTTAKGSVSHPQLSNAQLPAHHCHIRHGSLSLLGSNILKVAICEMWFLQFLAQFRRQFIILFLWCNDVQVAHRVFGLTNKLKMVFIPSGDDKRVMYNIVVAAIVSVTLYAFSLVLLNLPKMLL